MSDNAPETNVAPSSDVDLIRMYYEHQYDRIAKQEDQRHSITSITVTLSVVAFTFGFNSAQKLTLMTGVLLPVVIISVNVAALVYMERSRSWIRTHRARAKRVLELYAPALYRLDKTTPETYTAYRHGRGRIQQILHLILIAASCIPIMLYVLGLFSITFW